MAATNEEVKRTEFPILFGVFAAVIVKCLISFRSVAGTVLVFVPLALVSVLAYARMDLAGIGLKISTLPMVALGVGIGVVTWVFSPLQFQSDIGKLLTFMFLVNMIGAIVVLPALATWLVKPAPPPLSAHGQFAPRGGSSR